MEISVCPVDDHHYRAVMEIPFKLIGNIETLVVIKTKTEIYALLATKRPVMESKIIKLFGGDGITIDTIRKSTLDIKKEKIFEEYQNNILINI